MLAPLLLYCIIVADIYQDYPDLCTRLLLLLLEQSKETDTRHLGDLETHTGNITLGMAGTTEASHQHLVVFLEEVEATITRHEGCNLLASDAAAPALRSCTRSPLNSSLSSDVSEVQRTL